MTNRVGQTKRGLQIEPRHWLQGIFDFFSLVADGSSGRLEGEDGNERIMVGLICKENVVMSVRYLTLGKTL